LSTRDPEIHPQENPDSATYLRDRGKRLRINNVSDCRLNAITLSHRKDFWNAPVTALFLAERRNPFFSDLWQRSI
jgi:hypothetical protein